jgi:hypothetical protein
MPLYYAHFVIVEENLWLNHGDPHDVIRNEARYRVQTQLFAAANAERAYDRAVKMSGGFQDAHNDGPGDRTNFRCLGIHDLDEVLLGDRSLTETLEGPYGVDVGLVQFDAGVPTIPSRDALSIFSGFSS